MSEGKSRSHKLTESSPSFSSPGLTYTSDQSPANSLSDVVLPNNTSPPSASRAQRPPLNKVLEYEFTSEPTQHQLQEQVPIVLFQLDQQQLQSPPASDATPAAIGRASSGGFWPRAAASSSDRTPPRPHTAPPSGGGTDCNPEPSSSRGPDSDAPRVQAKSSSKPRISFAEGDREVVRSSGAQLRSLEVQQMSPEVWSKLDTPKALNYRSPTYHTRVATSVSDRSQCA